MADSFVDPQSLRSMIAENPSEDFFSEPDGIIAAGSDTVEEDVKKTLDNVNHPSHYNQGKIEVIEFIEDQDLGYHKGNAVKYICRAGRKGSEAEDIEKAIWFLRRRLEIMKPNPRRPNEMPQER